MSGYNRKHFIAGKTGRNRSRSRVFGNGSSVHIVVPTNDAVRAVAYRVDSDALREKRAKEGKRRDAEYRLQAPKAGHNHSRVVIPDQELAWMRWLYQNTTWGAPKILVHFKFVDKFDNKSPRHKAMARLMQDPTSRLHIVPVKPPDYVLEPVSTDLRHKLTAEDLA